MNIGNGPKQTGNKQTLDTGQELGQRMDTARKGGRLVPDSRDRGGEKVEWNLLAEERSLVQVLEVCVLDRSKQMEPYLTACR